MDQNKSSSVRNRRGKKNNPTDTEITPLIREEVVSETASSSESAQSLSELIRTFSKNYIYGVEKIPKLKLEDLTESQAF